MGDFNDSVDVELGEACNHLAAWVEPLPEGQVIDQASGLTERDLPMILRRLYAMRNDSPMPVLTMDEGGERYLKSSVPVIKKGALAKIKWEGPDGEQVEAMSGADLVAAYQLATVMLGDVNADALPAEFERRKLDI